MKKILQITALVSGILAAQAEENPSPWNKKDGQWITISGKVVEAGANVFKLDYGKGAIVVEMDDYDENLEGFNIVDNDQVVVTGRVDADDDTHRTIEAASVYVKNIKKSFFANPDDEEEVIADLRKATVEGTGVVITGKVIIIAEKLMTIETPYQRFDVSTALLGEDAFDNKGKVRIEVGDNVTVYGAITDGFMNSGKIVASQVGEQ
ncbi:MAG: hypothetical protein ACSHYF_09345 [Verrucomicrobiaceae bacterium]